MPLGHQLCANDDVDVPIGDFCNRGLKRACRRKQVEDSTAIFASGNKTLASSAKRSTPGPTGANRPSTPVFARLGHRFCFAALMAHQTVQKPMFNHPRITGFAPNLVSTGTAQCDGCISAAIDEQHGLFALQHPRLDMCNQITGTHLSEGNFPDACQLRTYRASRRTKPIRHRDFMILATLCIDPRFQ